MSVYIPRVQLSIFCPVRRGVGVIGILGCPKHSFFYSFFFRKRQKMDELKFTQKSQISLRLNDDVSAVTFPFFSQKPSLKSSQFSPGEIRHFQVFKCQCPHTWVSIMSQIPIPGAN